MLWSIVMSLIIGVVTPETPGRIGLSMMVNIDPSSELKQSGDALRANRALIMLFWNNVEGDSARYSSYNYTRYNNIMSNLPDTVSALGSFGWGTPKWASRARWIYDTLMEHFRCYDLPYKPSPWIDSCRHYTDIYEHKIKDRFFPPRPDSLQDGDSMVAYMDLWLKFVRTTVERYKDKIKYYEIWYEMDGSPPGNEPWRSDYIRTMKDTAWFFEHFYKPTARVIYRVCPDCKLVLPPRGGGCTLYDSYASFIDSSIAAGEYHYHNYQNGKFYGYYDRMFKYFSNHPTIDSVDSTDWCKEYPSFEYVDIHLYPYRYAPYYVDSNGVILDVLQNTLNLRSIDHPGHDTVTNYTIKGAIDLVERLANMHGIGSQINGYFLTEVGYLTYPPDTTEVYDSIHNIEPGFGARMYLLKANYFMNNGDENMAKKMMDFMYSSVLNYDTAAIYSSMLEELLDYLNDHGKRVIMAVPVTLKDLPYPYLRFEPWAPTYGFLFDLRTTDGVPDHGFKPKPMMYSAGLYQRYAGRKYLMTKYEEPFKNPAAPKIAKTHNGFKIYYTHGRRDITDQIVTLRGDSVVDTEVTNTTFYTTTPVFIKQNHHIYMAEADEEGEITNTVEESAGDDDNPSYIEFTPKDNSNEKIKYLFYRHNKNKLYLHHMDVIMPSSKLISAWQGVIYKGGDSISYVALYKGQNDTLYVAFVDYEGSVNRLHVLRFWKSYNVLKDEVVYTYNATGWGSACGIGNPVLIKGARKTGVKFVLFFSVKINKPRKAMPTRPDYLIKYTYYHVEKGWSSVKDFDGTNKILAMKGGVYLSTYALGVLEDGGVLRILQPEIREDGTGGYEIINRGDIVIDSSAGSFDMTEYGGLWYVVYEKMGQDTVAFDTRLPSEPSTYGDGAMLTNEQYHIEEKFPMSNLGLAILEINHASLQLAFDDKNIESSKMLFCKEPVVYVDTANEKLRIWYNLGGYGTYVLKGITYKLRPSVVIMDYPRVIQYGQEFNIKFEGFPGGESQDRGVVIERYEIRVKSGGEDIVYHSTLDAHDTVPTIHEVTISPIISDTEAWYTVEVEAYSAIPFTASNEQGPIYGRFVKMSKLPDDNRRWMVSGEDTVYIANGGSIKKHDVNSKIQDGSYVMSKVLLTNLSEESPTSGYYLDYKDITPPPETMATYQNNKNEYIGISHLVFGQNIVRERYAFSDTLLDTIFIGNLTKCYRDTMFYVWKEGNEYNYCVTAKDTGGSIPIDTRRAYTTSETLPEKPVMITSGGKVYIAYETDENTVKLDITDMGPRLLKSYTFSGGLPKLTLVSGIERDRDTVVLYYVDVENNGIVVRSAFIDTTLFASDRIYSSSDSITWMGVTGNNVIFTCIEKDGNIKVGNAVRYLRKDDGNVWNTMTLEHIRLLGGIRSPRREFLMPQVYRVNDTLVVMTWLEKVTWDGKTEYGGWIRIYNSETGNIQSGIIGIKTGLYGIMPNPTRGMLSIRYGVSKRMRVKIEVYDISGRKVRVVENDVKKPGVYTAVWDGRNERGKMAVPGVYIINMKAGSFYKKSKKVIIAR